MAIGTAGKATETARSEGLTCFHQTEKRGDTVSKHRDVIYPAIHSRYDYSWILFSSRVCPKIGYPKSHSKFGYSQILDEPMSQVFGWGPQLWSAGSKFGQARSSFLVKVVRLPFFDKHTYHAVWFFFHYIPMT